MPASPFDFEDPERFAPVEFPEPPDIEYVLGVRLERADDFSWLCPHERRWALNAQQAALACLSVCTPRGRDIRLDSYPLTDPKHPSFHERYAEKADLDRKRAKGE